MTIIGMFDLFECLHVKLWCAHILELRHKLSGLSQGTLPASGDGAMKTASMSSFRKMGPAKHCDYALVPKHLVDLSTKPFNWLYHKGIMSIQICDALHARLEMNKPLTQTMLIRLLGMECDTSLGHAVKEVLLHHYSMFPTKEMRKEKRVGEAEFSEAIQRHLDRRVHFSREMDEKRKKTLEMVRLKRKQDGKKSTNSKSNPSNQRPLIPRISTLKEWKEIMLSWSSHSAVIHEPVMRYFLFDNCEAFLIKSSGEEVRKVRWDILPTRLSTVTLEKVYGSLLKRTRRVVGECLGNRGYSQRNIMWISTLFMILGASTCVESASEDQVASRAHNWLRKCIRRLKNFEIHNVDTWNHSPRQVVPKNQFGWPDWEWLLKFGEPSPVSCVPVSLEFDEGGDDSDYHLKECSWTIRTEDDEMEEILAHSHSPKRLLALFRAVRKHLQLNYCKISKAKVLAFQELGLSRATGYRDWSLITQHLSSNGFK